MTRVDKTFEKLLWLFLPLSPILDLLSGIWIYVACGGNGGMLGSWDTTGLSGFSPSFLLRVAFLLVMAAWLLWKRNWRAVAMFAAIGVCWALTVGYEALRGVSFDLMDDAQYIVRYCYCLLALVAYSTLLKSSRREPGALRDSVDKALCGALLVLSLGVLVPYMLNMGFYTYRGLLGLRGCRGFFYAGNDVTAIMMLLTPVLLVGWMERQSVKKDGWAWLQAAASAAGLMAMLIIGTKTAFLAVAVTVVALGAYSLVMGFWKKRWRCALRLVIALAMVGALFLLLMLTSEEGPIVTIWKSFSSSGEYIKIADTQTVVFSGRTAKLKAALSDFRDALPWSALVGIGRGCQEKIIEMDVFEVLLYYGLLGGAAMLWLYVRQGFRVIADLFRAFTPRSLGVCIGLGLCVGYLVMAGHTLFSITAGFYFAFMLAYARLFCSREGMAARVI